MTKLLYGTYVESWSGDTSKQDVMFEIQLNNENETKYFYTKHDCGFFWFDLDEAKTFLFEVDNEGYYILDFIRMV